MPPSQREREVRISRISPPVVLCWWLRGARSLSSVYIGPGRRVPRLNSHKVPAGDAATHRLVCLTRAPSPSIDYFPPVGRKGRAREQGAEGKRVRERRRSWREDFLFLLLPSDPIAVSSSVSSSLIALHTHAHGRARIRVCTRLHADLSYTRFVYVLFITPIFTFQLRRSLRISLRSLILLSFEFFLPLAFLIRISVASTSSFFESI